MNYNKLDKNWKEFAKKENAELVYIEKELFNAIRCEYILTITAEFYKTKIVGTLWKSQDGHNRNNTIIYIKYNNRDSSQAIDMNDRGIKSLFAKNELKALENNIYQSFKKVGGKELKLYEHLLRLELNKIISKHSEFEEISEIINVIKNCTQ
ncbi:hypothetical protein P8625_06480 [Tenacibaculum tangerinum]|uniref:Uncharacterized protein n=1 Tax=Tenacibaculum tangerinum TaxID=3038772 RepID=A0ABY8L679_9FLAO|nr:hypothetical protein [Tenacibaculum tangerinum]WGH76789.1 hypothetical protein P8625_06480 [Tenacibaculum tangerinum]